MSGEDRTLREERERVGQAFDRAVDPLEQYEDGFRQLETEGIDPFEIFLDETVRDSAKADSTIGEYERHIRQFKEFANSKGRHPACVSDSLVISFADYEAYEKGNQTDSIKTKLRHINKAFAHFQNGNEFPHTDYNPVTSAWEKISWPDKEDKDFPKVTIREMREILDDVTHIFSLVVLMMGIKLGMRQAEIRNVKLKDIHIEHSEIQSHYSDLGTHDRLDGYANAIYIPSRYNRPENKSEQPRALPLDDEMRQVLTQYLLIRPDCGEPWVFLSQTNHERIRDKDGINRHWREQVRPHVEAEDHQKELTSHFGRHWFTTYWKIHQGKQKEYSQYMRGDDIGDGEDSIDEYLHAYYSDIEQMYRDEIYKLLI